MKYALFFLALLSLGCTGVVPTKTASEDLSALTFINADSEAPISLSKGNGYVIAYVNLDKDCSSCLRSMISVKPTVDTYEDVTFLLINKGKEGLDDVDEKIGAIDFQILVDPSSSMESYFHLKADPLLLIIDRDLKLTTALRVIDLNAFSKLHAHFHEMIQSL